MDTLAEFQKYLNYAGKSLSTQNTYIRAVRKMKREEDFEPTREWLLNYRERLKKRYAGSTVNTHIAALNQYLEFLGKEWRMKSIRVQRRIYMEESRELTMEDYRILLEASREDERLNLAIQSLCSTGMRISELRCLRVECLKTGQTQIVNKGKVRRILLPDRLVERLGAYCARNGIAGGEIFITRNGLSWDRSNIWRSMKRAAERAQMQKSRVYPHNLRRLFAKIYYAQEHDLTRLADLLGHSRVETTRIYLMTDGAEHRRQINSLGLVK